MHQPDDDNHTVDQYHDHMSAIADIVARWRKGEYSTWQKRRRIVDENTRYYGPSRKSPASGEFITSMPRTQDPGAVIADTAGLPPEAVIAALDVRRKASVMARQMLDDGCKPDAAALVERDGVRAYLDILKAASTPGRHARTEIT